MNIKNNIIKITFIITFALLTPGCKSTDESIKLDSIKTSPSKLYNDGVSSIVSKNYKSSIKYFNDLEQYYPTSSFIPYAIPQKLYAFYKNLDFDDLQIEGVEFLKKYKGHRQSDYVTYLIGMSYYNQISDIGRSDINAKNAAEYFDKVLILYPNSKYSASIQAKRTKIDTIIAAKEISIGRFYQKRNNLAAALGRFKFVIDYYHHTPVLPEAIYRTSVIYYSLGVLEESRRYQDILSKQFPNNPWTLRLNLDLQ